MTSTSVSSPVSRLATGGRHNRQRVQGAANGNTVAPSQGFRPDVQGLRAIAVVMVVFYHLYPALLPGGYVGVDVFFVISGFLITGNLMRTLERTGRLQLVDFYGRRARRLIPASALVLAVTWLLAREVLPSTQRLAAAEQIRASALYVQNWLLAHDSVDYLNADSAASPVQHFWSLSVEEQFYLVWPLLFVLAGIVTARSTYRVGRFVLVSTACALVVGSLIYSAYETNANQAAAFFVTTTRMWEFGIGGLAVLLDRRIANRLGRMGILGWLGLVLLLYAAFKCNGTSAFPGTIALVPVAGATLLLLSGSHRARLGPARLTSLRPCVFVGDVSYSLYLWHWPLIVLWLAYSGGRIEWLDGPAIGAASLALAWVTKVCVEDKVRLAPVFVRSPLRSLATATAAVVPVVLVGFFLPGRPLASRSD